MVLTVNQTGETRKLSFRSRSCAYIHNPERSKL
jgi:hypothetical protein